MIKYIFPFILLLISLQIFGQSEKDYLRLYYGSSYFMPSNGYAHSIGLQKYLLGTNYGTLNGEISFLYGGPYGFNFYATNRSVNTKISPYQAFNATLGVNFEFPLKPLSKNVFSVGLLGGYSRYLIAVSTQNIQGNIVSERGFFDPRNELVYGGTIRYLQWVSLSKLNVAIVPQYSYFKTSITTQSVGCLIIFMLKSSKC